MHKILVMLIGAVLAFSAQAQWIEKIPSASSMTPKNDIICYSTPADQNTVVLPPQAYLQWKLNKNSKIKASTFEVTYFGFPPNSEAQLAFQKAIDIWSTIIESDVPIRVWASWQVIQDQGGSTSSILGSAGPGTYYTNFDGAQRLLTWYPVALAEKMARQELNGPDVPDFFAQFNSAYPDWYFGTDGIPKPGKSDFVTVVLHEIGHGLGISKSYVVEGDNGKIADTFTPLHVIFDHFIENQSEKNLVQNFIPPSSALKTELTSRALYFRTPQLNKPATGTDNRAFLYAPSPYEGGSSIAHLDEVTYNNTPNSLMTPNIGTAEVIHNPGPLTVKLLADIGWVNTKIQHVRMTDTENVSTPYQLKALLIPDKANDYTYDANEVKLLYTTDGTAFTTVAMTATGTANEFAASIPAKGVPSLYGYYISIKDKLGRSIFKPGVYARDGQSQVNGYFAFEAGPDTQKPFINHTAKPFILSSAVDLTIEAIISDNIGITSASVEYQINGVVKPSLPLSLKPTTDSTYTVTIPLPGLNDGDKVKYRIRAKDISVAQNEAFSPSASEFYELNVVTLAATRDFYTNDFNSATDDFFGDKLFSITTPTGFANGAIHTSHPYPNGTGSSFTSNFIFQLKVPIRLKATDATLKFDEIVLIEPGASGSKFGDEDFFDYVIAEGSKDGGTTWKRLVDGYDSRNNADWLAKFNSSRDSQDPPNSTSAGDPSLYRARTITMTGDNKFAAGDEIVIRFRLLSDQLVHGWGWAIDNVKIQIDDSPPTVLHNHYDFISLAAPTLSITSKVSDDAGVSKLFIDYKIKNGAVTTEEIPIIDNVDQYTLNLTINGLAAGDLVEYRIRCLDVNNNENRLPATGFFNVPVLTIGSPVAQYIADFNSANSDFVGNFFSITQPAGFSNGAIHSTHSYPNGFGLTNHTSSYVYMLKKPITINAGNPYMMFDEIGIVEYTGSSIKDLIVVEGSKNNGTTWESILSPYSAANNATWKNAFDNGLSGNPSMYRSRLINLTSSGKFTGGDNVLIRFRLAADESRNGWGWSIDNLSIQGPVTGIEKNTESIISMYPNPVTHGTLTVEIARDESATTDIQILNPQGQTMIADHLELVEEINRREYSVSNWAEGIYFLRVRMDNGTTITRKFIKSSR